MPIAGVTHCPACHAVVNIQWTTCVVCSQPIKAVSKPTQDQWLQAWRGLARLTNGITKGDSRFAPVMAAIDQCDDLFLAGDWPGFQQIAEDIGRQMKQ